MVINYTPLHRIYTTDYTVASISKTATGYRASIYVKGTRDTKCFRTQREANAWASRRETELRNQSDLPAGQSKTFKDALERYLDEVVPKKRGMKAEAVRVGRMLHSPYIPLFAPICKVTESDIALYRDTRLKQVSAGSVLREIGLLSALFEIARVEWRWVERNPVKDVKKPPKPRHRERVISGLEIRKMLRSLDYKGDSVTSKVGQAFLLSLMTGMRAGEVCSLKATQDKGDYLADVGTKTTPRNVPLSKTARRFIDRLSHGEFIIPVQSQTLDTIFRRHRQKLGLAGFVFHDARHTAATRMAKKVDVLTLCKIFGWTNPSMAMVYYNPTASEISRRL